MLMDGEQTLVLAIEAAAGSVFFKKRFCSLGLSGLF